LSELPRAIVHHQLSSVPLPEVWDTIHMTPPNQTPTFVLRKRETESSQAELLRSEMRAGQVAAAVGSLIFLDDSES
jgi:hypothetical protein